MRTLKSNCCCGVVAGVSGNSVRRTPHCSHAVFCLVHDRINRNQPSDDRTCVGLRGSPGECAAKQGRRSGPGRGRTKYCRPAGARRGAANAVHEASVYIRADGRTDGRTGSTARTYVVARRRITTGKRWHCVRVARQRPSLLHRRLMSGVTERTRRRRLADRSTEAQRQHIQRQPCSPYCSSMPLAT